MFLVDSITSLYYGAKAKVRYDSEKFTDFIELRIGVLQGDTLAPYLFVIVMDCGPRWGVFSWSHDQEGDDSETP